MTVKNLKAHPVYGSYLCQSNQKKGVLVMRIVSITNALHKKYDPNNPHPRSSDGFKWMKLLRHIWYEKEEYEGSGVVVIPSDPSALLKRLDLLFASQEVGHTGVRNELVGICDELKRQGVL